MQTAFDRDLFRFVPRSVQIAALKRARGCTPKIVVIPNTIWHHCDEGVY